MKRERKRERQRVRKGQIERWRKRECRAGSRMSISWNLKTSIFCIFLYDALLCCSLSDRRNRQRVESRSRIFLNVFVSVWIL